MDKKAIRLLINLDGNGPALSARKAVLYRICEFINQERQRDEPRQFQINQQRLPQRTRYSSLR